MAPSAGCPGKCSAPNIKEVSQSQVGITPRIARAAKLRSEQKLYNCFHCGSVWYQELDPSRPFHLTIVLGEYDGMNSRNEFVPEGWLRLAIDALSAE